jgi:type II secretory pathway pseudopilin PulG
MKRQPKYPAKTAQSGFSTVELLIGVIIMGILVAIIVPIVTNRTREARITAANSDLERIASAMERVVIDTGYVVRLFVLDDSMEGDGVGFELPRPYTSVDRFDGFSDQQYSVYWDPDKFFINPRTHDYVRGGLAILTTLTPETNFEGSSALTSWRGPYLTWQRDSELPLIAKADLRDTAFDDIGDDPWGNNYLLFTRDGLVREVNSETSGADTGILDPTSAEVGDIVVTVTIGGIAYDTEIFGEFTVLSMGPDGQPGVDTDRRFGAGDDLIRHF